MICWPLFLRYRILPCRPGPVIHHCGIEPPLYRHQALESRCFSCGVVRQKGGLGKWVRRILKLADCKGGIWTRGLRGMNPASFRCSTLLQKKSRYLNQLNNSNSGSLALIDILYSFLHPLHQAGKLINTVSFRRLIKCLYPHRGHETQYVSPIKSPCITSGYLYSSYYNS